MEKSENARRKSKLLPIHFNISKRETKITETNSCKELREPTWRKSRFLRINAEQQVKLCSRKEEKFKSSIRTMMTK
jgi:hypothetical protein